MIRRQRAYVRRLEAFAREPRLPACLPPDRAACFAASAATLAASTTALAKVVACWATTTNAAVAVAENRPSPSSRRFLSQCLVEL